MSTKRTIIRDTLLSILHLRTYTIISESLDLSETDMKLYSIFIYRFLNTMHHAPDLDYKQHVEFCLGQILSKKNRPIKKRISYSTIRRFAVDLVDNILTENYFPIGIFSESIKIHIIKNCTHPAFIDQSPTIAFDNAQKKWNTFQIDQLNKSKIDLFSRLASSPAFSDFMSTTKSPYATYIPPASSSLDNVVSSKRQYLGPYKPSNKKQHIQRLSLTLSDPGSEDTTGDLTFDEIDYYTNCAVGPSPLISNFKTY